ncbi:hypothetical protein [Moorena sp. SIO1F2]|uniref:hypothetical protein n=1 Tax=Moorena sp. SIO1F2 TaxID=2607819 RepID=UPI0025D0ACDF|nr:hypothetical protein [Moorena sp. SIO1F2]
MLFLLPTPYSRLPIPHSRLPTLDSRFPTPPNLLRNIIIYWCIPLKKRTSIHQRFPSCLLQLNHALPKPLLRPTCNRGAMFIQVRLLGETRFYTFCYLTDSVMG